MAGERTIRIRFAGDAKGLHRAADDGGKAMGRWAKGVEKAGAQAKRYAAVAGVAVGAALSAGIGTGLQQSKTTALLNAQLGATGADAERYGQAAGKVYGRGIVSSMEEATEAVRVAVQNALVPKDASVGAIDQVASRITNLAAVMQSDASTVSAAVSTMLKTGMADSAEEAFDMLHWGVEQGLNKTGDLLDSLNEYPSILQTVGLDGQTTFGLMGQAAAAGARDTDKVVDALKELSLRAVDGSKATSEAFQMLGVDGAKMADDIAAGGPRAASAVDTILDKIREMPPSVERAQIIQGLFGGPGEDLGASLFALDVSKAAGELDGMAGSAKKAGDTLEGSTGAAADRLKNKLQQGLIGALGSVAGWMERNSGLVKGLAAVLGPLVVIIGTIIAITKIWTAVQTAFNIIMALNPVALIVIGIVALIAIIVVIATKTTWFQTVWDVVWGAIKKAFSAWWAYAKWVFGLLVAAFNHLKAQATAQINRVISIFQAFKRAAGSAKDWVVDKFKSLVSWFKDLPGKIRNAFSSVKDIVSAPFRAAFNAISNFWNSTAGQLSFTAPSWVPGIGGKGFSLPHLPQLQHGGPAVAGRTYLVGERGPELLTMGPQSGTVTPNHALGGPSVLEAHIHIGDEVVRVVRTEINESNRQVRRRVLAGAGAR